MNRRIIALSALALLLGAVAVHAYDWETEATLTVIERPGIDPDPGWLKAKSYHTVEVTQLDGLDLFAPIYIQIVDGSLMKDGWTRGYCFSGLVFVDQEDGPFSITCMVSRLEDPCVPGTWQSSARGYSLHFHGETKFHWSPFYTARCECL